MLRLYCDGVLLWQTGSEDKARQVTAPKLVEQLGKVATLSFTMPPGNAGYGSIEPITSRVTLYEDGAILFHGRPVQTKKDINLNRQVVCESAMGFLRDSIWQTAEGMSYGATESDGSAVQTVLAHFLDLHNREVGAAQQISLGNVSSIRTSASLRAPKNIPSTLELLLTLPETYPGTLLPRWAMENGSVITYLDYTEDGTIPTSNQTIRFGVNMLDLKDALDGSGVFTVLTGYDADNDAWYTYRNDDLVNTFGTIHRGVVLSGINSRWSYAKDGLQAETERYYAENAYALRTLSLKAIDLSLLGVEASAIRVGQYHRVVSERHGMDGRYQCQKVTRLLDQPGRSTYEFGKVKQTLTERLAQ